MFEFTEEQLKIMIDLLVERLKKAVEAKIYPYGNPQEKGRGDKIASGQLLDSIHGGVEIDENGNPVAVLYYADYFKYVNRGRPPYVKRVPTDVLVEWIKIKGLKPGRDKKGRFKSNLSLAFAIQQNIFRYGIRKTNIYDRGIDDVEDYFKDFPNNLPANVRDAALKVFDAVFEDINDFIDNNLVKIDLPTG